jgi:hypothetical protein
MTVLLLNEIFVFIEVLFAMMSLTSLDGGLTDVDVMLCGMIVIIHVHKVKDMVYK